MTFSCLAQQEIHSWITCVLCTQKKFQPSFNQLPGSAKQQVVEGQFWVALHPKKTSVILTFSGISKKTLSSRNCQIKFGIWNLFYILTLYTCRSLLPHLSIAQTENGCPKSLPWDTVGCKQNLWWLFFSVFQICLQGNVAYNKLFYWCQSNKSYGSLVHSPL